MEEHFIVKNENITKLRCIVKQLVWLIFEKSHTYFFNSVQCMGIIVRYANTEDWIIELLLFIYLFFWPVTYKVFIFILLRDRLTQSSWPFNCPFMEADGMNRRSLVVAVVSFWYSSTKCVVRTSAWFPFFMHWGSYFSSTIQLLLYRVAILHSPFNYFKL